MLEPKLESEAYFYLDALLGILQTRGGELVLPVFDLQKTTKSWALRLGLGAHYNAVQPSCWILGESYSAGYSAERHSVVLGNFLQGNAGYFKLQGR